VTPAVVVGIVALAILAAVLFSQPRASGESRWRLVYVGGIVASLYLLVFVAVAQAFMKIAFLRETAPTQSEPPFAITQVIVLLAFVVLGLLAARSFKPLASYIVPGSRATA
jgi:fatty acid desaturase